MNFGDELFFVFVWRSPVFVRKKNLEFLISAEKTKPLNFGKDLFFFGDHLILTEKPPESKTNENLGQVRFRLYQTSKKAPPPLRNPGYATAIDNKVICAQCIHSYLIRIIKF